MPSTPSTPSPPHPNSPSFLKFQDQDSISLTFRLTVVDNDISWHWWALFVYLKFRFWTVVSRVKSLQGKEHLDTNGISRCRLPETGDVEEKHIFEMVRTTPPIPQTAHFRHNVGNREITRHLRFNMLLLSHLAKHKISTQCPTNPWPPPVT